MPSLSLDTLQGAKALFADAARRPRFVQIEAALNLPLIPRLGSKSEACARAVAQAHGYMVKKSPLCERGDRTVVMYRDVPY